MSPLTPAPVVPVEGDLWWQAVTLNVAKPELHVMKACTWWVREEDDDGFVLTGRGWNPDVGVYR